MLVVPNIIGGEENHKNEKFPVYDYKDHDNIIHHFSAFEVNEGNLREITEISKQGFKEWGSISYKKKWEIFSRIQEILKERRHLFIDAHVEIGGPKWFAEYNIDNITNQIQEYMSQLSNPDGEVCKSESAELALAVRQPIGPVLAMSPWNAPVLLGGRSVLAPLAAGCSVIAKSSERAPYVLYLLIKAFLDGGIPKNALQMVNIKPEDSAKFTDEIMKTGAIKKLNFTGSTNVGKAIASTAGKYLVPCLLELGGKNIAIVLKDADLTKAAETIVGSAVAHKGQICMSVDIAYIDESVYDKFKVEIKKVAENHKDDDLNQRDKLGRNKVVSLIEDALDKGADLVYGDFNKKEIEKTNVIEPFIFENVTPEMKLYSEESFGPLFTIEKFSNVEEVVAQFNETEFGLKASIWSKNPLGALSLAKKIEAGGVHINGSNIHDEPSLPHGGVKGSGTQRFNSKWGVDSFSFIQTITMNS
ncbi:unnamed protein product [Candida verbasci]|uniref:Aldehyde dehydrogenase domain-containing protein n=1 Tax=Candida verbasci TaxID=1227364 RepID=A0A9W4XKY3_9ASCO|nr:unnamed protein product [Candida verbasci]